MTFDDWLAEGRKDGERPKKPKRLTDTQREGLKTLARAALHRLLSKSEEAADDWINYFIEIGRGSEIWTQTAKKTDPDSVDYMTARYNLQDVHAEADRRQKYHGSLSPIKPR